MTYAPSRLLYFFSPPHSSSPLLLPRPFRAGLRHVRGVRPNRAAKFRGPQFWTLQKLILPVWTTMMLLLVWCKLPADTRFDVSLDWHSFCHSLQSGANISEKNVQARTPPLPLLFPHLFSPSFPPPAPFLPSCSLEQDPLNPARGPGERFELPQRGQGVAPPKSNLVHFGLKIWHRSAQQWWDIVKISKFLLSKHVSCRHGILAPDCNADQRTKNAATRCVLRAYNRLQQNATVFGAPLRTRGSAPDPAGGSYSDPYRSRGGAAR